jgi:hypothetical protein
LNYLLNKYLYIIIYNKMYSRQDIERIIPNSSVPLNNLYQKYKDIKWIYYFYIDNDHEEKFVAISSKGDIVYNTYYVGVYLPQEAVIIERRLNEDGVELEENEIYYMDIKKDVSEIPSIIDRRLRRIKSYNN